MKSIIAELKYLSPRISNIITQVLLLASTITLILDYTRYGISGLTLENTFVYDAYSFNLIYFSIFLLILFIKYKHLALPIFLITYTIWDALGISGGIYSAQGWFIPYYQYWFIASLSTILAVYLYKKKILQFKLNNRAFLFMFILDYLGSPRYILDHIILINQPLNSDFLTTILIMIVCYLSIKPNPKDLHGNIN